ncbi:lantibiotic dehydratase [Mucilaginibacter sp. cycad4]|uniref:lantibiotic dehydratase n=1 Tax=Mucilaginibacter sp. cycad4 TaxID=3342096 RepID=UPI002AAB8E77|nr:lantibiotic dehydratase [Mucilaginibacter gossypii]WPV01570.1 lantibiotic dehydratase [Mucilaginibacter gossypii]
MYTYDFYTLRIPTFSVNKLTKMNAVLEKLNREDDLNGNAIRELQNILSDETFLEGLFLASPVLFKELKKWLSGSKYNREELIKLLLASHKYYIRMCSRCTPFGTFAGTTTGLITNEPSEIQFQNNKFRKTAEFDMGFLSEIIKEIIEKSDAQLNIKFRANDTLYKVGDQLLFTESVSINGRSENILSSVSESSYINKVLASGKELTGFDELVEAVRSENASISVTRIEQFIRDLISSQILISEFNPQVTGDNNVKRLVETIGASGQNPKTSALLKDVYHKLKSENLNLNSLTELDYELRACFTHRQDGDTLQETLFFNTDKNSINANVVREISKHSEILWELQTPESSADLKSFKQRFDKKFEGKEVPLFIALDTEAGVGYGSAINGTTEHMPLLKNIVIRAVDSDESKNLSGITAIVQKVVKTFYKTGSPIIEIDERDILDLKKNEEQKSKSVHQNSSKFIFGSIIASSTAELDDGNYKFLAKQLFNYSAGRMLGRFACGDPVLNDKLSQLTLDEENLNNKFILAEVLHNPGGHATNVVSRPSLRRYEIPINCSPSVDKDHVIFLEDLLVSIQKGRVILRSKSLNKEVLPQMTNAFNVQRGEPLLKFLSDIQSQQIKNYFVWNWEEYYKEEYLPRVEFKKIILTRARWRIKKNEKQLFSTIQSFKANLKVIRNRLNIPRYVTLVQSFDNELCLDLNNDFCLRQLQRHLKNEDAILLEFLQTEDNCFIKDQDGAYCNEIIIPYGAKQPAYPDSYSHESENHKNIKSIFLPGSEWFFLKIYGGNKCLDYFLKTELIPFCDDLLKSGYIDKWFFIRYDDPDRHIRLRFHTSGGTDPFSSILLKFNKIIDTEVADNKISKVLIDSYVREVERYTATFMEDSEDLFFADSEAVGNFLSKLDGDEGEENRWIGALYSVDLLLSDFDCSVAEKQEIIQGLSNTFFQEFAASETNAKALNYSLNNKYREKSSLIKNLLTADMNPELMELFADFGKRSKDNELIINRMRMNPDFTHKVKAHLLKSYIHMNLNRIFLSRARNHELVVYHFLKKYYTMEIKLQNQLV